MATTYRADWVFSPQQPEPIKHGVITVHEGKFVSVEPWDHETVDVDLGQSLVIPGLVNYHVHLDLGGLRGKLPRPKSFTDWLRQVIHYRRSSDPHEWDQHIEAGIQESIRYGCTHLSDISVGGRSEQFLRKSNIGWDCRLELIGMSEERIELALQQSKAWLEKNTLPPRYFLSPHAPYTVSRQLLSRLMTINPNTQAAALQVAMHVAETREEIELLEHHGGPFKTLLEEMNAWHPEHLLHSIEEVIEYLNQFDHAMLIHGNYLTRQQWRSINSDFAVVYCPRTHAYFGHEPHPYLEMLNDGVNVRLGTDSLASNPDLNLLEEGRFLWRRDRKLCPLLGTYLLEMMTFFESAMGKGSQADFVVIPYDTKTSEPYEALWGGTALPTATYCQGQQIYSSQK